MAIPSRWRLISPSCQPRPALLRAEPGMSPVAPVASPGRLGAERSPDASILPVRRLGWCVLLSTGFSRHREFRLSRPTQSASRTEAQTFVRTEGPRFKTWAEARRAGGSALHLFGG